MRLPRKEFFMKFWCRIKNWWKPTLLESGVRATPVFRLWESLNLQKMRGLTGCTEKAYQQLDLSSLDPASLDELSRFVRDVEIKVLSLQHQVTRLQTKLDAQITSPEPAL